MERRRKLNKTDGIGLRGVKKKRSAKEPKRQRGPRRSRRTWMRSSEQRIEQLPQKSRNEKTRKRSGSLPIA